MLQKDDSLEAQTWSELHKLNTKDPLHHCAQDIVMHYLEKRAFEVGIILPNSIMNDGNNNFVPATREGLIKQGFMHKYYSTENIEQLLLHGKLPAEWDELTLMQQGFLTQLALKYGFEEVKRRVPHNTFELPKQKFNSIKELVEPLNKYCEWEEKLRQIRDW